MDPLKIFKFDANPFENFDALFKEAKALPVPETNAMALSTVSSSGQPTTRVVYFKGFIDEGWSFYTNYEGRKGRELSLNPHVGCNFFWPQVSIQVRIDGVVEKLTRAQNEAYFNTRARLSQIGAWASYQSEELDSREEIETRIKDLEKKYAGGSVPCPPNWGGFKILSKEIEFWFGVEGRIHYRFVYSRQSPYEFFTDPSKIQWKRLMKNP